MPINGSPPAHDESVNRMMNLMTTIACATCRYYAAAS